MNKFAQHKALKLIAQGKLTFDEKVVLHREKKRERETWASPLVAHLPGARVGPNDTSSQACDDVSKNLCSGSEAGAYLRLLYHSA